MGVSCSFYFILRQLALYSTCCGDLCSFKNIGPLRPIEPIAYSILKRHFNLKWTHHPQDITKLIRKHPLHFLTKCAYRLISCDYICFCDWFRCYVNCLIISIQCLTIAGEFTDSRRIGKRVDCVLKLI